MTHEARFIIKAQQGESKRYWNGFEYYLYADIQKATRYLNKKKANEEAKYVRGNIDGIIEVISVQQDVRSFRIMEPQQEVSRWEKTY